jgi:hypothetical protein
MAQPCSEHSRIQRIEERLGGGDVTLALLDEKLGQILEQTKKTNGRVTKLEDESKKPRVNIPAAVAIVTCCAIVCTSLVAVVRDGIDSYAKHCDSAKVVGK